ncbi:MAG: hypothetical protein IPQ13_09255 [Holophagaceae bacterium]|nr:hypothetical protein [Holophagaceae bacterium]
MRPHRFIYPILALLSGCGGGGSSSGGGTTPPPSNQVCPMPAVIPAPKFSADILPALQSSCGSATSTCHGTGVLRIVFSPNRTATEIYSDLTNPNAGRAPAGWVEIKPGDPAHSWLIEKISPADGSKPRDSSGQVSGDVMPLGSVLCANSIANIRAWVQAGAPNN